jgi:hypothetical protein
MNREGFTDTQTAWRQYKPTLGTCPIDKITERVDVAVSLWTRIRIDRDFSYTDSGSFWYSLVPPGKYRDNTSIRSTSLPSKSSPNYHSSSIPLTVHNIAAERAVN